MSARLCIAVLLGLLPSVAPAADGIVVGSKAFTEGYILGEIAAQTIAASNPHVSVSRRLGMGGTGILFEALAHGAIDVYPDYTGTLAAAVLKDAGLGSVPRLRAALRTRGIVISDPLGFDNTYALAVREEFARRYGLQTIGDLRRLQATIRAGFSYEFADRPDGYAGLMRRYHLDLNPGDVQRMEHSLTYQAIARGAVDVIDVYSTDANIRKFRLRVLRDDLGYFPAYQAVWVAREDFVQRHPVQWQALQRLQGSIDDTAMLDMNAEADIGKQGFAQIAARFRGTYVPRADGLASGILQRTEEHLWLVGISLLFSIAIGVPLGIAAARFRATGQAILLLSAMIQTLPSLALLCFLIPLFGVGMRPALVALCLYSLLPVVLNTLTGIRSIDPRHLENARAFGLNRPQILWRIVLPLASPMMLAGIKTATIVSIGTATLAALVGAGGYGAPIVSGLSLNDIPTILTGAIPAALMAWVAYGLFEILERLLISRGLRTRR